VACLDDSTVLQFVAGRLNEASRRRVEAEIGRCGHCAALVAGVARSGLAPRSGEATLRHDASDEEPAAPAAPEEGASDRYVLGGEIARGGMGTIWRAFDRRLSRSIAVKCLDSRAPSLAARFAREVRITASLQHPGIVPIYDAGVLPDGRHFYAMRHVPGATLDRAIEGERGEGERLGLLAPVLAVAEAVAYAHDRGVIHRDLKPSNVLVGPFGETVVIDWGLAKVGEGSTSEAAEPEPDLDPEAPSDPAMTREGTVLGTPRYMAPEQARGEPATRRSDVYALGAILYHALSGRLPFAGGQVSAVLARAARAEVAPLTSVAPGLPSDLVAIVERAMAPSPEARYAAAGELAADLRRFQTGQLVAAHAYSRRDLVRRFARRHRAALTLAAFFALVLTLGGALSLRRIVSERERADRERVGAETLVQFLMHDLRAKLRMVGRLDVLDGVADRVESYYLATAAGQAELPEVTRERADLYDLRAMMAETSGDGASAGRHLARGFELIDQTPPSERTTEVRASLLNALTLRTWRLGQAERALALSREAVSLRRALLTSASANASQRPIELAQALGFAAFLAERRGQTPEADRDWTEAGVLLDAEYARAPNDLKVISALARQRVNVGESLYERRRLGEAKAEFEAARVLCAILLEREPPNIEFLYPNMWADIWLADVLATEGQAAEAEALRESARETAALMVKLEPTATSWRKSLARTEADLATMAAARADWASASAHLQAARASYEYMVGLDPNNHDFRRQAGAAVARLAEAEAELGREGAARDAWRASLEHLSTLARSDDPGARLELANGLRGYAAFERKAGHADEAESAVERALALVQDAPATPERPEHTFYRAAVFAEVGVARAARRRQAEALEVRGRAAALLRELAVRSPLEPEWARLQRELEAELAPTAASGEARRP
jgi:Protein kinase domain